MLSLTVAIGSSCWLYFGRPIDPVGSTEPYMVRSKRVSVAPSELIQHLQPIVLFLVTHYSQLYPENHVDFWPVQVHVTVAMTSE
jgi:hypothetical protein